MEEKLDKFLAYLEENCVEISGETAFKCTVRSAQLFISIIPILVVYPFLQKFFVKGITVGSVKE